MAQRILRTICARTIDLQTIIELGGRPEFWLTALLIWALASASRSLGTPWAAAAGTELLRWAAGIGLALTLSGMLRRITVAGRALVLLAGAMALCGIFGGTAAQDGGGHGGLTGPYREHQLYGSVLLLLLPFAASAALSAKTFSWRWGALAALAAGVLCLGLSETRSAWLGFLAAAGVFAGLRWQQLPKFLPKRIFLIPLAALAAGVVGFWLLASPADERAAVGARAATLATLGHDESWQTRLALWRGTLGLVEAHPALGIGLGRYPGAEWAWTGAGGLLAPTVPPSLSNEAHSFYGQTAAEIGLPGLGLYLAALAAFAARARRRLAGGPRRRGQIRSGPAALVIAAGSALAGQSVDALASPSWQFPEASVLFWAVLGLGLAALRRDAPEPASARLPAPLGRAGRWALSGGLAVALAAQILPLGLLLTPVEAYSAPAGYTLVSRDVTLTTPPRADGTFTTGAALQFKVIANYKTDKGVAVSRDVTKDPDTSYGGTLYPVTGPQSVSNSSVPGGVYTIPSRIYGPSSRLDLAVRYTDSGTGKYIPTTIVTALVVQVRPN